MKIMFLGATHEVTGSCFYLEACGKRLLVDCGMEQGPNIYSTYQAAELRFDLTYGRSCTAKM